MSSQTANTQIPSCPSRNSWLRLGPFTVFDIETTGFSPTRDRIVEIAAIRLETDGTRDVFHSLVNPGRPIPRSVSRIHGITDFMVTNAEDFREVGERFMQFAENSTLAAHNARFDLGFLQESLSRELLPLWNGKTLDTLPIFRRAFPGLPCYKLSFLRDRFATDASTHPSHRAVGDVECTVAILDMAFRSLTADS